MRIQEGPRLEKIFTKSEKAELWTLKVSHIRLDKVDFRAANLSGASFERVSLTGCDFTGADLQKTSFLRCDLRRACFEGARFGKNRFDGSWFTGASGLSAEERAYVVTSGGQFLRPVGKKTGRKVRAGSPKRKAKKRR